MANDYTRKSRYPASPFYTPPGYQSPSAARRTYYPASSSAIPPGSPNYVPPTTVPSVQPPAPMRLSAPSNSRPAPMRLSAPSNSRPAPMRLSAPSNSRPQLPALPQPTVPPALAAQDASAAMDSLDERMAEGRAEGIAAFNREREAYQDRIADMTTDEFRQEVSNTNRGSGNYFDMTEGQYGRTDTVIRPRNATENFNAKLASMSPEELKKEAFTSTQSGLKERGSYGGRGNYSAEGSLRGRENALAAAGGLQPTTQMNADRANAEADARRRARNEAEGRSPEDSGTTVGYERAKQLFGPNVEPGSVQTTPNGNKVTVGLDTKDPFRALDGNSVLLGVQGRYGGPRRDGQVRQGPNGEYVPGGDLTTNEKFMAQRERRAQRREDALATRRAMLPYRTRGVPMNAIFLNEAGRPDALMNAGMPLEASRRDQVNNQRAEMARQFDERTRQSGDQFDARMEQDRRQFKAEQRALERRDQIAADERTARDMLSVAQEDRERQRDIDAETQREFDRGITEREQQRLDDAAKREAEQDAELDSVVGNEITAREMEAVRRLNPNQGPIPAQDDYNGRVEHINTVVNNGSLSSEQKQRILADVYGVTSAEQAEEILKDSDYANEWFFGDGLFMVDDEEPYRRRYSQVLRSVYGG